METMEKVVYLDNAATTACAPEVLAVMTQALSGAWQPQQPLQRWL